MTPEEMAEQAICTGLDAVVITEHNIIWSEEELAELRRQFPALTIWRGFEVSAADRHDILVYGIADTTLFPRGMSAAAVVTAAHQAGGVAVLAHPFRYHLTLPADLRQLPFDACEIQSINSDELHKEAAAALAAEMGAPGIYNSDAHDTVSLGAYANIFPDGLRTEQELVDALRARQFTPVIRPEWLDLALEFKYTRLEKRIQALVAQGHTDVMQIWARTGGAVARIERMLEACRQKSTLAS